MYYFAGVGVRTGSCVLTLFYLLVGVVLGCSGNGDIVFKVTGFAGGPTTLDGDISVSVVATADVWRRVSCGEMGNFLGCVPIVLLRSLMIINAASGRTLPRLVPVAVSVVEARLSSTSEVLVAAAVIKSRGFCSVLVIIYSSTFFG